MKVDITPRGVISNVCLSVRTDGSFHLEKRFQQMPTPTSSIHVYESFLKENTLQELLSIPKSHQLLQVPPYTRPPLPVHLAKYSSVSFEIKREGKVQEGGYFIPGNEGKAQDIAELATKSVSHQWSTSRIDLIQLMNIFRAIQQTEWAEVPPAKANFCGKKLSVD